MGKLDSMCTRVKISLWMRKDNRVFPVSLSLVHLESFLDFLLLDEKEKEEEVVPVR
jgi:hypothetical protein